MEASNIPSDEEREAAERLVAELQSLPTDGNDGDPLTAAELIDALGAAGLKLTPTGAQLNDAELRDAIADSLRSRGPEATTTIFGNALHAWAALDLNYGQPTAQPTYPYVEGDFLILGPEIFTNAPGTPGHAEGVISWQGENYVVQPPAGAGG